MKILKISLIHVFVFCLLSALFLPVFIYAQDVTGGTSKINIPNPLANKENSLIGLITTIINSVVMPIAAVFVVVWIIYAGFKYVMAQGNPAKIKEAHQTLLWALVGAGILLGAAGISKVVENTVKQLVK